MHMQRMQGVHLICCDAVLLQCVVKGAPATSASHVCGVLQRVTVCCKCVASFCSKLSVSCMSVKLCVKVEEISQQVCVFLLSMCVRVRLYNLF